MHQVAVRHGYDTHWETAEFRRERIKVRSGGQGLSGIGALAEVRDNRGLSSS
jgi:hypothetical protein